MKPIWKTTQPIPNSEIVVWFNHPINPSFHSCVWAAEKNKQFYSNDWDIEILPKVYVGPKNFEGGVQFLPHIKDKEFYWMTKEEFLRLVKIKL